MNVKKDYKRTYNSWRCLRQRCDNPNNPDYHNYGGKGITYCDRWNNFHNFLKDMGERPLGKTLDRIVNTKGYSPDNCKWSTPKEQAENRKLGRDAGGKFTSIT